MGFGCGLGASRVGSAGAMSASAAMVRHFIASRACMTDKERVKMADSKCIYCGKHVVEQRDIYALPVCYRCLPPPEPLSATNQLEARSPKMRHTCVECGKPKSMSAKKHPRCRKCAALARGERRCGWCRAVGHDTRTCGDEATPDELRRRRERNITRRKKRESRRQERS